MRRRARSIPPAPHRPPMRLPASRSAAVRGPSLTGMTRTPSLTRPGWYATAPYRSTPTATGCTTSPGRRTWWPRPASRRSLPGGTSPQPRSANGWSGCMRSPPVPVLTAPVPAKADATSRARPDTDAIPPAGHSDGPCPGSGGANPEVAQSVKRRTHPAVHQHPAAPVEQVGAPVGRFHAIGVDVRKRELAHFVRRVCAHGGPVSEAGSEPVCGVASMSVLVERTAICAPKCCSCYGCPVNARERMSMAAGLFNVLICRVSWMREYRSLTNDAIIEPAGKFPEQNGWGGECWNFRACCGRMYGYARVNPRGRPCAGGSSVELWHGRGQCGRCDGRLGCPQRCHRQDLCHWLVPAFHGLWPVLGPSRRGEDRRRRPQGGR